MKEQIKKFLPRNRFARSVSILAGGTAAGQAVVVLASPLLTRLYSPEDFGLLAVYASLLTLILVVSSLRYELAIPLPEDDWQAANIVALCLLIVLCTSLLTAVAVLLFREPIANALGVPTLASYMWLLPIGVLLGGVYPVFNYWAIRTKSFTAIASTKLWQALATIAIQLAAFRLGGVALLFGQVAGQSAGTANLARPVIKNILSCFNWSDVLALAKRYMKFPLYSANSGVIQAIYSQSPAIFLSLYGYIGVAGFWLLANRVAVIPYSLFSTSINQAIHKDLVTARENNSVGHKILPLMQRMVNLSLGPAIILIFFASYLIPIIFGEKWSEAANIIKYALALSTVTFIFSPMTTVISVMEWQKTGLWFQGVKCFVSVGVLAILLHMEKPFGAIIAYCVSSILLTFIYRLSLLRRLSVCVYPFLWGIIKNTAIYGAIGVLFVIISHDDVLLSIKIPLFIVLSMIAFFVYLFINSKIRLFYIGN